MKHFLLLAICLIYILPQTALAQGDTVDLKVGDSLTLQQCSHAEFGFLSIDIVTKTRWVDRGLTFDSATGEGFYYYFFNEGDFDSKRLPCEYGGKKFRIAGIQQVKGDNGEMKTILFGRINNDPLTVLWVEVEQAAMLKELVF